MLRGVEYGLEIRDRMGGNESVQVRCDRSELRPWIRGCGTGSGKGRTDVLLLPDVDEPDGSPLLVLFLLLGTALLLLLNQLPGRLEAHLPRLGLVQTALLQFTDVLTGQQLLHQLLNVQVLEPTAMGRKGASELVRGDLREECVQEAERGAERLLTGGIRSSRAVRRIARVVRGRVVKGAGGVVRKRGGDVETAERGERLLVRVEELLLRLRREVAQDLAQLPELVALVRIVARDVVRDYGRDEGGVKRGREFRL